MHVCEVVRKIWLCWCADDDIWVSKPKYWGICFFNNLQRENNKLRNFFLDTLVDLIFITIIISYIQQSTSDKHTTQ